MILDIASSDNSDDPKDTRGRRKADDRIDSDTDVEGLESMKGADGSADSDSSVGARSEQEGKHGTAPLKVRTVKVRGRIAAMRAAQKQSNSSAPPTAKKNPWSQLMPKTPKAHAPLTSTSKLAASPVQTTDDIKSPTTPKPSSSIPKKRSVAISSDSDDEGANQPTQSKTNSAHTAGGISPQTPTAAPQPSTPKSMTASPKEPTHLSPAGDVGPMSSPQSKEDELMYDSDGNAFPGQSRRGRRPPLDGNDGDDDEAAPPVLNEKKGKKRKKLDPALEMQRQTAALIRKHEPKLPEAPKPKNPIYAYIKSIGKKRMGRRPNGDLYEMPWSDEATAPDPPPQPSEEKAFDPKMIVDKLKPDRVMSTGAWYVHEDEQRALKKARAGGRAKKPGQDLPQSSSSESDLDLEVVHVGESLEVDWNWGEEGAAMFPSTVKNKHAALKQELRRMEVIKKKGDAAKATVEKESRKSQKGKGKAAETKSGETDPQETGSSSAGEEGNKQQSDSEFEREMIEAQLAARRKREASIEAFMQKLEDEGTFRVDPSGSEPENATPTSGSPYKGYNSDETERDYPLAQPQRSTPVLNLNYTYSMEEEPLNASPLFGDTNSSSSSDDDESTSNSHFFDQSHHEPEPRETSHASASLGKEAAEAVQREEPKAGGAMGIFVDVKKAREQEEFSQGLLDLLTPDTVAGESQRMENEKALPEKSGGDMKAFIDIEKAREQEEFSQRLLDPLTPDTLGLDTEVKEKEKGKAQPGGRLFPNGFMTAEEINEGGELAIWEVCSGSMPERAKVERERLAEEEAKAQKDRLTGRLIGGEGFRNMLEGVELGADLSSMDDLLSSDNGFESLADAEPTRPESWEIAKKRKRVIVNSDDEEVVARPSPKQFTIQRSVPASARKAPNFEAIRGLVDDQAELEEDEGFPFGMSDDESEPENELGIKIIPGLFPEEENEDEEVENADAVMQFHRQQEDAQQAQQMQYLREQVIGGKLRKQQARGLARRHADLMGDGYKGGRGMGILDDFDDDDELLRKWRERWRSRAEEERKKTELEKKSRYVDPLDIIAANPATTAFAKAMQESPRRARRKRTPTPPPLPKTGAETDGDTDVDLSPISDPEEIANRFDRKGKMVRKYLVRQGICLKKWKEKKGVTLKDGEKDFMGKDAERLERLRAERIAAGLRPVRTPTPWLASDDEDKEPNSKVRERDSSASPDEEAESPPTKKLKWSREYKKDWEMFLYECQRQEDAWERRQQRHEQKPEVIEMRRRVAEAERKREEEMVRNAEAVRARMERGDIWTEGAQRIYNKPFFRKDDHIYMKDPDFGKDGCGPPLPRPNSAAVFKSSMAFQVIPKPKTLIASSKAGPAGGTSKKEKKKEEKVDPEEERWKQRFLDLFIHRKAPSPEPPERNELVEEWWRNFGK